MTDKQYLVHFTSFKTKYKKFDDREEVGLANLLSIIENGFLFSARRTFTSQKLDHQSGIEMWVSMICFTETSLKDIAINKDKFGNFGICMKKSWVEKYSGQPVLYSSSSSFNNQILNRLNDLIYSTQKAYLDTQDDRVRQASAEIADLSNMFQALMEPMNHKPEKEIRIINYPNSEILNRDLVTWRKEEVVNNCLVNSPVHYLPISQGEEAEFIIIPKGYLEIFCSRVVNSEANYKKLRFIEDIWKS